MKRSFFLLLSVTLLLSGCVRKPLLPKEKIETQIKSILEIPAFEHIYRDIIYIEEEASFFGFHTIDKKVLFAVDIKVQAGIDFTDGVEIIQSGSREITIKLPFAKILLVDADEKSIKQYFLKEKGDKISLLEYYDEIDKKKENIVQDSIERGILNKAEENAVKIIESSLLSAGFTSVKFEKTKPASNGENND